MSDDGIRENFAAEMEVHAFPSKIRVVLLVFGRCFYAKDRTSTG
jgi:hypothetical protein